MKASDSNKIEEEFIEAKNNWELEKLYVDLASAKGKALTPVEKKFLRGLLCGFSPAEIANTVYKSRSSSTVRVYLSNGLYKYIEEMLSIQAGYSVKVKNWSRVTHLLEKAGYKKAWIQIEQNSDITINIKNENDFIAISSAPKQDWGEASDVSFFYGRNTEIARVKKWIVQERCRLIVLLGMGGIGKTALSVKLAEEIQETFEFVIWRSLHLAPPLEIILHQLNQFLSQRQDKETTILQTLEESISQLIDCLRASRCLLILDKVDSILYNSYGNESEENSIVPANFPDENSISSAYFLPQIRYRPGYEGYGELIRRIGDSQHQSCLLLTSREKPGEIAALEGETLPVRCLKLTGLEPTESIKILTAKGFADKKKEESELLINLYAGNPLFIKLVATAIQEIFSGRINEFLDQNTLVFGEIRGVLDQQFNRLSGLEKQIMYWLALNRGFVSLQKLQKSILPRVSQRLILEAIELLQRRSLIQRQTSQFSQIPVLIEYIGERLIEENLKLSEHKADSSLISHTFLEMHLKNYIREIRLNAEI